MPRRGRHRALDYADQRNHQYATREHLLLPLIDDADASAGMRSRKADLGAMKAGLRSYLEHEPKPEVQRHALSASEA